jgi:hypothetical protein
VYWPSSDGARPVTMKNEVVALPGSAARAIDRIPLSCSVSLNSGGMLAIWACCRSVSSSRREAR